MRLLDWVGNLMTFGGIVLFAIFSWQARTYGIWGDDAASRKWRSCLGAREGTLDIFYDEMEP